LSGRRQTGTHSGQKFARRENQGSKRSESGGGGEKKKKGYLGWWFPYKKTNPVKGGCGTQVLKKLGPRKDTFRLGSLKKTEFYEKGDLRTLSKLSIWDTFSVIPRPQKSGLAALGKASRKEEDSIALRGPMAIVNNSGEKPAPPRASAPITASLNHEKCWGKLGRRLLGGKVMKKEGGEEKKRR